MQKKQHIVAKLAIINSERSGVAYRAGNWVEYIPQSFAGVSERQLHPYGHKNTSMLRDTQIIPRKDTLPVLTVSMFTTVFYFLPSRTPQLIAG